MTNHQRSTLHPTESAARARPSDETDLAPLYGHPLAFLTPHRLVWPPSWIEHIPFAFWLTDVLRPHVFVELGTHSGNSYAAFAQAVQHLGVGGACYAIDTWKGDDQAGLYDEAVFTEWRAYHDQRYSAFSRLIRSTFDQAVEHFADRSVDLLHIDGFHTSEAVEHDFRTWRPKMSVSGVVLLHDINVRERNFGAWQVWEELRDTYPSFEFLHGHGLGVLAVGTELPPDIAWLTNLRRSNAASVAPVREFFSEIGATVLMRYNAGVADAALLAAKRALEEARTSLAARDNSVTELHARLAGVDRLAADAKAQASALNQALLDVKTETSVLNQRLVDAQAETSVLNQQLVDAQTRVNRTTEQLLTRETACAELSTQLLQRNRAYAVQESLNQASAQAAAAASAHIGALTARLRVVSGFVSQSSGATSTFMTRAVRTLRALGLTPRAIARRPGSISVVLRLALDPRRLRDAHLIAHSGLFDARYYLEHATDVAAMGINPLAHFVLSGGAEGRSPHPLFDSSWYLARYEDIRASGMNPLAHYLRTASTEVRDPHPLFSSSFYRAMVPGITSHGPTPLQHYVTHGALEQRSPHPLFDPDFYLEMYGHAIGGINPLVHFLEAGAAADCNPHPLFDLRYYREQLRARQELSVNPLLHYLQSTSRQDKPHPLFDPAFYLRSYKDVSSAGIEPLTHFVLSGGAEGRRPGKNFDSEWYLRTYGDVAQSGANPLVHFVRHGWRERRNPSPHFDTSGYLGRYPDVVATDVNPLVHYVEHGRAEGRVAAPIVTLEAGANLQRDARVWLKAANLDGSTRVERAIVCLTHVMPLHPRAGNEYRIHRMLRWLRHCGYVVIPIVAPTDGSRLTSADLRALAAEYGNAVFCPPDGQLEYVLRDVPDVLRSLDGESTPHWATMLEEDRLMTRGAPDLLAMDRAFCTDALISTVLRLQSTLGPYVLLAEYIWMSRVLPLVAARALKIIDTIDVFSSRAEKVGRYGIDDLTIDSSDEIVRLERADLLVAIQDNERQILEGLAPAVPTVTSGVDFDVVSDPGEPTGCQVLCVASGNPMNRRGLRDFVRFCWPRVRELVPAAELMVVGGVGNSLLSLPPGVRTLGKVADLRPLYQACRVAINPAVAGTGVKIKTVEALAHLRPIVTWPNGVDGLSPELAGLCLTAHDWYSFASHVAHTLTDDRPTWFSEGDREMLRREGSPAHVYVDLDNKIQSFFAREAARLERDAQGA